jgi:hypothetical protein
MQEKDNKDNKVYICGCGRTYSKNASLLTHIRQKHDGIRPENTQIPSAVDRNLKDQKMKKFT